MKFIFEITLKNGHTEDEYVRAWKTGSAIIQREPGAICTRLHRKIGQPGKLLAIARWESKSLRDAAMQKLNADETTKEIINKHQQFAHLNFIGEFEDPEWTVESPN